MLAPKPHIVAELKAMGFGAERAGMAALATRNQRTQDALDWLLANPEAEATGSSQNQPSVPVVEEDDAKARERREREAQDHAIALQLAAQENSQLSLEDARQLRRGFSKVTVSRDPNVDELLKKQRKAMLKGLEREDMAWDYGIERPRQPPATNVEDCLRDMVTKHDSDECGAKNAQRLMNLQWSEDFNHTGDLSAMKISNKTYNSFRRQIQRLKTRSDRKITGGRPTRAAFAKKVSNTAEVAIAERDHSNMALGPGSACVARASADNDWHTARVTGLATTLPRRYKVRFEATGVEEFVKMEDIREVEESSTACGTERKDSKALDEQMSGVLGVSNDRINETLLEETGGTIPSIHNARSLSDEDDEKETGAPKDTNGAASS